MKTLLTGATGFVGAAVLRRLIAAGHDVRALVRPNSDRRNLSDLDCEIAVGDLAEPESVRPAVRGCEAVFHVAADYRLWVPDAERMKRVNIQGTVDLIRAAAAAGASRIVYTSSVATLRLRDDGLPADEKSDAGLSDMIGRRGISRRYSKAQCALRPPRHQTDPDGAAGGGSRLGPDARIRRYRAERRPCR
jgi:dihydroflavonol-4-reductase